MDTNAPDTFVLEKTFADLGLRAKTYLEQNGAKKVK